MNKNIKKIIAMALVMGTISAVAPTTNISLLSTKAYASSTNDESTLESLELNNEADKTIKFYEDNDYKDRVDEDDVEDGETYYAKTSSNKVSIDISGPDDKYVRVFKGNSDSAKGKEVGDDIQLSDDSVVTTIVIKVYGKDTEDDTIRNNEDDDNEYDLQSTYQIKVKHVEEEDTSDTDYADIYLDRLSVDGSMINLSESKTNYTYNVKSDVSKVAIRATPEDDDYDVTIDGDDVDSSDNYKSTVDLDKGENDIKIEIEDGEDKRVYTLVINRGSTTSTSSNTTTDTSGSTTGSTGTVDSAGTTDSTVNVTIVKNNWVQVDGKWQYKDAAGNTVKNSWVQNYFVQADGNMATGWLSYNGKWYYLGVDGARKTGWQQVNGKWYYLDTQGGMQTGWMKDMNGKYYYLNSDGSMAYDTKIGVYKLGTDGAWIGK